MKTLTNFNKIIVLRNTNGGGEILASPPYMVSRNTTHLENIYFSPYYNGNGTGMAQRYWKIPSSSFEVEAIPPPPLASPPEVGSIASTSQDSEGIF